MPTDQSRAEDEPTRPIVPDLLAELERSLREAREARDRVIAERPKRKDCGCD